MNLRFRSVQSFLQDTSENVLREVGRWLKGVSIRFGIGAALFLIALFALANGLALSVVEAGLPPYAAWLILTVVAAGAGYALFKAGAHKGIAPEAGNPRPRRLTVEVVRTPRRRRPAAPVYRLRRRTRRPGRVRSK